jgi:hypothetical protein
MGNLNHTITGGMNVATLWTIAGIILLVAFAFLAACIGYQFYCGEPRRTEGALIKIYRKNAKGIDFMPGKMVLRNQPLTAQEAILRCSKIVFSVSRRRHLSNGRRQYHTHFTLRRKVCV